jgi:glutaredoxin
MKAVVWSKDNCPFCEQAKSFLKLQNVEFEERKLGHGWTKEQLLESVPDARTVPQIFLDGKLIGGFSNLSKHFSELTK